MESILGFYPLVPEQTLLKFCVTILKNEVLLSINGNCIVLFLPDDNQDKW